MLQDHQDAFGHEIYDYYHGLVSYEIVERDDGFFSLSPGPQLYFLEYEQWPAEEREAMEYVRGRVLDIGCGAGRHSLYLQSQGFEVVGLDNSPLALQVCRARGLKNARLLSIDRVSRKLGVFDTLLLLGNNFALLGDPQRAVRLLARFDALTSAEGRLITQTRDPYLTDVPEHFEYHARNRQAGRLSGQARIRVRYKKFATPWIDFLMLSRSELDDLLAAASWSVAQVIDKGRGTYVAILEKRKPG
jgi:SAM-dependent methyltransferase